MHSTDRQDVPGKELLRLARSSIEYGSIHGRPLPVDCSEFSGPLTEPRATFTTLRLEGELRGCCGTLEAARPLASDVTHTAFQAAYRDTRFAPLARSAVLSPMELLRVADEADLLRQLTPGTDGLVIVEGLHRATFLPKVWESVPEPRRFLAQLKTKCGLPGNYWSDRLEFFRYRTTTYAEAA